MMLLSQFGAVHVNQGSGSWKWRWGYMEGVKSEKPDAKFIFNYVGSYNDPAKSKSMQSSSMSRDASLSIPRRQEEIKVCLSAKRKRFYTSGQDVDLTSPDNPWIVTSQIKDTYATMQYLLDQYYSDKWTTEDESLGVAEVRSVLFSLPMRVKIREMKTDSRG